MTTFLKRAAALVCTGILVLGMSGCSKDLNKEDYKKDIDVAVSAEPTSLSMLEPEISAIASEYDQGGSLVEALAVYQGDTEVQAQKGTLYFTYCRYDEDAKRTTTVVVTYSMFDQKATEVSYEQADGKPDENTQEPVLEDAKKVLFSSIFDMIRADKDMGKKLDGTNIKLSIEFTSEGFVPSLI